MEVYEQINLKIQEKSLTKREFAKRLIALEPKSKRTGETMSEKAVYAYLNGKSVIDANLLPYIAEVLGISEQMLFKEDEKTRTRLLTYLLESLNEKEEKAIRKFCIENLLPQQHHQIVSLLPYASEPMLRKIEKSLQEMKSVSKQY